MKHIHKHLKKLKKIKRSVHHPLLHKLHKKYGISRKTLFYVKEYGPHSNVPRTIIKESIKILLLASIISAFGGFALENIKALFVSIIPLIVLLPALNDLIGDFGTIISARFATMLHEGKIRGAWQKNPELKKLFMQVLIVAGIMAVFSASISVFAYSAPVYPIFIFNALKIFFVAIADVVILAALLFLVAVFAGIYFFKKGEDPNNFLIPITTSIADFGNMFLLAALVVVVF